jgi:hypothetical protein
MLRTFFLLSLAALIACTVQAQQQSDFPQKQTTVGRLIFNPLIANYLEPRVGLTRLVEEQRLRLDIGNSIDLFSFHSDPDHSERFAVGTDFFTWSSLRQSANFHFPVDAVDYLFGLNVSYLRILQDDRTISGRFRWSHISAHLVDGSYDKNEMTWRLSQLPRVYSREFFELIAAVTYQDFLRVYGGGQYIYHIDPSSLGKAGFELGIELSSKAFAFPWLNPYIAYDCRFIEFGAFRSAHSVQAGAKLGFSTDAHINIYLAFYHGPSQHGEFYDATWSYFGPGFNIEF